MKLILVRHGESMANADRSVYYKMSDHTIPLTAKGEDQAERAGELVCAELNGFFRDEIEIHVSPYRRAKQTWILMRQMMGPSEFTTIENPLLREQEYKIFADTHDYQKTMNERADYGRYWWRFKGGESVADVHQRCQIFINDLRIRNQGKQKAVVVVAHEITLRCILQILGQDDITTDTIHEYHIGNCEPIIRGLK